MKRLFTSIITFLATLPMLSQGWPAQYEGVMLQGFYWDSYADTNWANLESQADEMSQFFDLIWVPNSAYANSLTMNMGYHPVYWFDHKSAFGTEAQLRSMINTFKAKGTGMIEDVVINHRASVDGNWLNFPAETYKGVTYQLTAADICQDDEAKDNGYKPTGAKDTGENWGGARDLDHTGANVQKNVNAYLDFLMNDLGYVGFRYDYVKGFAAKYVGLYNKTAQPKFSVGECWDGNKTVVTNWMNGTKQDGAIQSAAFDFPLKYYINDAFADGKWSRLKDGCLADDDNYKRYAVTFVDNHDTGRFGECPLYANVEAANAFILTMPGTPCVWLSHWQAFKTAIKKLITVRKAVGVSNESTILSMQTESTGCTLMVQGSKGKILLLLGEVTTGGNDSSYKLVLEGTNYQLFVSGDVDLSALDDIHEDTFVAPDFCVVNEGEICAFFEAPTSWTTVKCWAWDDKNNYTGGTWPGAACTKVGTNNDKNVWKWSYSGTLTTQPTYIIFNNNNNGQQTADLDFKNGGYYNEAGALQGTVTGMEGITLPTSKQSAKIFTLDGRQVQNPGRGIYIVNGKKYVK
ncbi:MAG: starch-binding protein [Prevotella sp.]|nr:starch-binding protein [Prevotella sp.]